MKPVQDSSHSWQRRDANGQPLCISLEHTGSNVKRNGIQEDEEQEQGTRTQPGTQREHQNDLTT